MTFPDGNWFNRKRIKIRQLRCGKMFRTKLRYRTNRRLLARGLAKSEERWKSRYSCRQCGEVHRVTVDTCVLGSWVECCNCGRGTEYFSTEGEAILAWKLGDTPYPEKEESLMGQCVFVKRCVFTKRLVWRVGW